MALTIYPGWVVLVVMKPIKSWQTRTRATMEPARLYSACSGPSSGPAVSGAEWLVRGLTPAPRPPLSHPVVSAGGQAETTLPGPGGCSAHKGRQSESYKPASPGFVCAASTHDALLPLQNIRSAVCLNLLSKIKPPIGHWNSLSLLRLISALVASLLIRFVTERHPF